MVYFTRTNLENRLSKAKVLAIYEDDPGVFNEEALAEIIQAACDLTDATVARALEGKVKAGDPTPAMLKEPSILYGMAMSIERNSEIASQYGEKVLLGMRKVADTLCDKIATGLVRIVDAPLPSPGPVVTGGLVFTGGPTLNSPGGHDGY